jgi:hypothetical protein
MSLDPFLVRYRLDRLRKRAARVALLRAMGGVPTPFAAPCFGPHEGITVVVHRDTYPDRVGQWRVTRFEAGESFGHFEAVDFNEALSEAQTWRAELRLARSLASLATEAP